MPRRDGDEHRLRIRLLESQPPTKAVTETVIVFPFDLLVPQLVNVWHRRDDDRQINMHSMPRFLAFTKETMHNPVES